MTTCIRRPLGLTRDLAKRTSMILLLVLTAGCREKTVVEPEIDLNGDWTLSVESVCQGPMSIVQTGNTLNVVGSVGGGSCPFSASGSGTGSMSGREISFGIGFGTGSSQTGTGLGSISFEGDVAPNGNRMSGTFTGSTSGSWEASRN
jgi:hypothetical protein